MADKKKLNTLETLRDELLKNKKLSSEFREAIDALAASNKPLSPSEIEYLYELGEKEVSENQKHPLTKTHSDVFQKILKGNVIRTEQALKQSLREGVAIEQVPAGSTVVEELAKKAKQAFQFTKSGAYAATISSSDKLIREQAKIASAFIQGSQSTGLRLEARIQTAAGDVKTEQNLREREQSINATEKQIGRLSPELEFELQEYGVTDVKSSFSSLRRRGMEAIETQRRLQRGEKIRFLKGDIEDAATPYEIVKNKFKTRSPIAQQVNLQQKFQEYQEEAVTNPNPAESAIFKQAAQNTAVKLNRLNENLTKTKTDTITADALSAYTVSGNQTIARTLGERRELTTGAITQLSALRTETALSGAGAKELKSIDDSLKKATSALFNIDKGIDSQNKRDQEKEARNKAINTRTATDFPVLSRMFKQDDGEDPNVYRRRLSNINTKFNVAKSAGLTAAGALYGASLAVEQRTVDLPRQIFSQTNQALGGYQSDLMNLMNLSPEARVLYGGNALYAGRDTGYLGAPGRQKLFQDSLKELDRTRDFEKNKMIGSLGQIGLGALGIAGGVAAGMMGGMVPGIMLGTAGLTQAISGFTSSIDNKYVQEQGYLDSLGNFSGLAGAGRQAQLRGIRSQLQQSELERRKFEIATQTKYEESLNATRANVEQYGAYGVDIASLLPTVPDAGYKFGPPAPARASLKPRGSVFGYTGLPGHARQFETKGITEPIVASPLEQIAKNANSTAATLVRTAQNMNLPEYAQLGYSAEAWASRMSSVGANVLGTNAFRSGAAAKATMDLTKLSFAGLGDFGAMAGNASALASITGRTTGTEDLKKIMTEAVRLGFDNSKTGQQFIQGVTGLANQLGFRSTERLSALVGQTTQLAGGRQKDLERALSGLAAVDAGVASNQGFSAVSNAMFVSGGFLGGAFSQLAFQSKDSPIKSAQIQKDLTRIAGIKAKTAEGIQTALRSKEFSDLSPEAMQIALGLSTSENFKSAIENQQKAFGVSNETIRGFVSNDARTSKIVNQLNDLSKTKAPNAAQRAQYTSLINQLSGYTGQYAGLTDPNAALALTTSLFQNPAMMTGAGSLDAQQKQGEARAREASQIQAAKTRNTIAMIATGRSEAEQKLSDIKINPQDRKDFRLSIPGMDREVNAAQFEKIKTTSIQNFKPADFKGTGINTKEELANIQKTLQTTTKLQNSLSEMMNQQSQFAQDATNVQNVRIVNVTDITAPLMMSGILPKSGG